MRELFPKKSPSSGTVQDGPLRPRKGKAEKDRGRVLIYILRPASTAQRGVSTQARRQALRQGSTQPRS